MNQCHDTYANYHLWVFGGGILGRRADLINQRYKPLWSLIVH